MALAHYYFPLGEILEERKEVVFDKTDHRCFDFSLCQKLLLVEA